MVRPKRRLDNPWDAWTTMARSGNREYWVKGSLFAQEGRKRTKSKRKSRLLEGYL